MLLLPYPHFGTFIKRYKRFFADIVLDNGTEITAHCANSGAMLDILQPGNKVAVTLSNNPNRKLPYTWQAVYADATWIGVNTHLPNELVFQALLEKYIPDLSVYSTIRREVKYGENSRIDFLLTQNGLPDCYLEIKNVHLKRGSMAVFPDSVTARGTKHLKELSFLKHQNKRCVILYIVQRNDCDSFSIAADIDSVYAKASQIAKESGVELLAYGCEIDIKESNQLKFLLSSRLKNFS